MALEVLIFVLILFIVSLTPVGGSSATSSSYEHRRRLLDQTKVTSFNSTPKVTHTGSKLRASSSQEVDHIAHYCAYQSSEAAYAGTIATMDVYDFPNLKKGERIAAQIWLSDRNTQTQVISGWEVNPGLYGDSKTHFFIYWTTDRKDGCANLDCVGFIPLKLATITPGDTLEPSSGQSSITLKIFISRVKKKEIGGCISDMIPIILNPWDIGQKVFSSTCNKMPALCDGGGTADSFHGQISPPMGNGQWPGSNSAASFKNVQYVDVNGQGYDPPWDSLHAIETHRKCYQTGVFRLDVQGNMFYYGGPGGCTS